LGGADFKKWREQQKYIFPDKFGIKDFTKWLKSEKIA
jgi:hypothetical protein